MTNTKQSITRAFIAVATVSGSIFAEAQEGPSSPAIEEIVVTAQRRAENPQQIAVPLTVLPDELLREAPISKPQDLTHLVPALQAASNTAPYTVYYLRGVGNFTGNSLSDPAVAFNFNGVSIGRPSSTSGLYYDLERIEVLKGPQGTLYGRNATGGAINLIPRGPSIGEWGGDLTAEFAEYDSIRLDAALNVPLGETSAMRFAGNLLRHDGYMNDGLDDQDDLAGRVSWLIEPNVDFSIELMADYFSQQGLGPGSTPIALGIDNRFGVSSAEGAAYYEGQRVTIAGRNFNAIPLTQQLDNEYWGISATIEWNTSIGSVTMIPAWRESHLDVVGTASGMTLSNVEDDEQASIELRLASDTDRRLTYIAGAYYFDETNDSPSFVVNNQYNMSVQQPVSGVKSTAVFGTLTYSFTDTLRGTLGARYTNDEKSFGGTFQSFSKLCVPLPTAQCPGAVRFPADLVTPPYSFPPGMTEITLPSPDGTLVRGFYIGSDDEKTFSNTTWRAAIAWDAAEDSLLYGSIETGFKSGGFFFSNDSQVYYPEEVEAFTLGSKNRFLNDRLQLNAEAFYWRYENQQISTITVDSRGATNLRTRNIGFSTIKGVEVATVWLATDHLELGMDLQYLDAVYDSFQYVSPPSAPPLTGCAVSGGPPGDFQVDCSGKVAPYAPKWTANIHANQIFDLGNGSTFVAEARAHYQSEMLTGQDFTPLEYQDSYWWVDASLSYNFGGDAYSITAFANNLTDETVIANTFQPPFGLFVVGTLRPPQVFGLRFGARF